jgi:hypothetical protein
MDVSPKLCSNFCLLRLNLRLVSVMGADVEPHDLVVAPDTKHSDIPIHPRRPVASHRFEMQRRMVRIFQPNPELFSRLQANRL